MKQQWNKAFSTLMCWLYAIAYPAPAAPAAPAGGNPPAGGRIALAQPAPAGGRIAPAQPATTGGQLSVHRFLAWWQAPAGRWVVCAALIVVPEVASAGFFGSGTGGALPWMKPLGAIASSLSGPVARVGVLIAIAFFGLLMMFGELKGIFGTAARILFGASLALGAVQWAGVLNFGSGNSASSYINSGAP